MNGLRRLALHSWSLFLLTQGLGAAAFSVFVGRIVSTCTGPRRDRRQFTRHGSLFHSKSKENDDEYCPIPAVLPVFPLRKSVKLPTETLTLNLYEERYLAMCDFLLNSRSDPQGKHHKKVFGAIYGSEKPQIVPGGTGPIVPLYEPGDIGTIFCVEHADEGHRRNDKSLGRRIRILGRAIGRFRIEKILQNGYGGGDACTGSKVNAETPFPFILVEPSRVQDVPAPPGSDEEKRLLDLQQNLIDLMLEESIPAPGTGTINGEEVGSEGDDGESEGETSDSGDVAVKTASRSICTPDFLSGAFLNDTRGGPEPMVGAPTAELQELFSFAAFLVLAAEQTPQQMQTLLRMTSTLKRLEFIMRNI
ncbi:expressed unknown protein [Seminavis robusta]|uniref:Lon N-terminal domain-containing protein n=1 Tax=Seminavis robusta TaxID=568900 RepID=A0A9N8D6S7_9STRA|nr:expressed unknown protein [Seminavis robusta]|eukprot:Sro20_g014110.1 n/a (362) ;mRNA; r:84424-85509